MDAIYEVHGLTKRYGRTAALNGVDFDVTPGKLVGLLGPNGSGKTTLMKISAGPYGPADGVHRRRCRKPVRRFLHRF